ncbi:MAG TPA: hypothetical protein VKE74_09300 [Gemmataceae bacterium]|nr:hypothetical protein [Gemmataceae bacterium]
MLRLAGGFALVLGLLAGVGCNKGGASGEATEAGPGSYCRLGPIGLSVESVRVGKVRMRAGLGRAGESKDDVCVIKTRFRLLDTATPVKQFALQRDGSMMGGGALKLRDEGGTEFKPVGGFGFDSVRGRRSDHAILSAENPEATDVLTFEPPPASAGDLVLEVPANWQEQQPDGTFLQPKDPGTFRFRIPRAMWTAEPPTLTAGPGNWFKLGPVGVEITGVKLGKAKMSGIRGEAVTADDVLSVTTNFRVFDPKVKVKKSPFMTDGSGFMGSSAATLASTKGEQFKGIGGGGLDRIVGRQERDVELSAAKPGVADMLTFEAKAGAADELILTLWPNWQEQAADGKWVDPEIDGEFRFRIPRSMWAK